MAADGVGRAATLKRGDADKYDFWMLVLWSFGSGSLGSVWDVSYV